MSVIKILHTGDLHLGSLMHNMGDKAKSRSAELTETFSNIISLAIEEKVDAILIAGDLFEKSNPSADLLDFVAKEFERAKPIPVFIVWGNHDYGVKCNFPSNVYVFGNEIEKVSLDDADIYGVSFTKESCSKCIETSFCADNINRTSIFVVHSDMDLSSSYNPVTEDMIKSYNMDYIAMGHVHSHNGFCKAGSATYSYCGIPEGRAFDECGVKGVIIAEIGKGYTRGEFVPMCSREYICKTVDISGACDNFEIAKKVSLELGGRENAYRVILKGEKNTFVDTDFIKDFLEKEYYFADVKDESEEITDEKYTLKKLFVEKCNNENALKYGLSALRGEKVRIE